MHAVLAPCGFSFGFFFAVHVYCSVSVLCFHVLKRTQIKRQQFLQEVWLECCCLSISFQELDLSKEAFFFTDTPKEPEWTRAVSEGLHPDAEYALVRKPYLLFHTKDYCYFRVVIIGTNYNGLICCCWSNLLFWQTFLFLLVSRPDILPFFSQCWLCLISFLILPRWFI